MKVICDKLPSDVRYIRTCVVSSERKSLAEQLNPEFQELWSLAATLLAAYLSFSLPLKVRQLRKWLVP